MLTITREQFAAAIEAGIAAAGWTDKAPEAVALRKVAAEAKETSTNFNACPLKLAGLYDPHTHPMTDRREFVDAYDQWLVTTGTLDLGGFKRDTPFAIVD